MAKTVQGYFVCISTSKIYFLTTSKYIWKPNRRPNNVGFLQGYEWGATVRMRQGEMSCQADESRPCLQDLVVV